jgi:hypothetical protein
MVRLPELKEKVFGRWANWHGISLILVGVWNDFDQLLFFKFKMGYEGGIK